MRSSFIATMTLALLSIVGPDFGVLQNAAAVQNSSRRVQEDRVPEDRKSELGVRQRFVEQKMVALENRFTATAERIKESEPDRAKRLVAAFQQAKEKLITRNMVAARKMLDEGRYKEADTTLNAVVERLDELLRLLMNDKTPAMTKKEELAQMQQWKKAIQDLKKEQNQQTKETNKVANKEEALKKLDGQIKQVSKLIGDQEKVILSLIHI